MMIVEFRGPADGVEPIVARQLAEDRFFDRRAGARKRQAKPYGATRHVSHAAGPRSDSLLPEFAQ